MQHSASSSSLIVACWRFQTCACKELQYSRYILVIIFGWICIGNGLQRVCDILSCTIKVLELLFILLVLFFLYAVSHSFSLSRLLQTAAFFAGIALLLFGWTFSGFFVELFGFFFLYKYSHLQIPPLKRFPDAIFVVLQDFPSAGAFFCNKHACNWLYHLVLSLFSSSIDNKMIWGTYDKCASFNCAAFTPHNSQMITFVLETRQS